jgi:methylated-DNA-protein-cysteine methyltransferase-like protein
LAAKRSSEPEAQASLAERILACVESIPAGRVMTYGDVAEFVDSKAPRHVGHVLSADGGSVPWHRVLKADGTMAPHLADEQRQLLISEGVRVEQGRVSLARYRWNGR